MAFSHSLFARSSLMHSGAPLPFHPHPLASPTARMRTQRSAWSPHLPLPPSLSLASSLPRADEEGAPPGGGCRRRRCAVCGMRLCAGGAGLHCAAGEGGEGPYRGMFSNPSFSPFPLLFFSSLPLTTLGAHTPFAHVSPSTLFIPRFRTKPRIDRLPCLCCYSVGPLLLSQPHCRAPTRPTAPPTHCQILPTARGQAARPQGPGGARRCRARQGHRRHHAARHQQAQAARGRAAAAAQGHQGGKGEAQARANTRAQARPRAVASCSVASQLRPPFGVHPLPLPPSPIATRVWFSE